MTTRRGKYPVSTSAKRGFKLLGLSTFFIIGVESCYQPGELGESGQTLAIDNNTGTGIFNPSRLDCTQHTSGDYSPLGTYSVATVTKTYVDPGRTTRGFAASHDDNDSNDSPSQLSATRRLPTKIWYPDASGSFPVVVYAHGVTGNRDEAAIYAPHIASWGYIVVAPLFPEFHLKERNPADWSCSAFYCDDGDGLCTAAGPCGDGSGTCVAAPGTPYYCNDGNGACTAAGGTCGDGSGTCVDRCAPRMAALCPASNPPHNCCTGAGQDNPEGTGNGRCWKTDPDTYNFSKAKTTDGRRAFIGGMNEVARDIQFVADQVIREYNDLDGALVGLGTNNNTKVKQSSGGSGKTDVGVIGLGSMVPQFVGQHPNVKIPTSTISAASSQTVDSTIRNISVSNTNGFAPTSNGAALRPTFWAKLTTGAMTAVACQGTTAGNTFTNCTISGSDSLPAGSPIYQSAVFTRATAVTTVIPTFPSTIALDVTGTHGFRYVSGQYKLYVQATTGGGVRLVTCTGPSPSTPGTQFTGCSVASGSVTVPQHSSVDDASYTTLDRNVHAFNLRAVVGAGSKTFTQGAFNYQPLANDYIPNNDVAYTWISGTSDMLMPPDYMRRAFNFTKGSVNWIELSGATHFGFVGQQEPDGADGTGKGICETYMCRTVTTSSIYAPTDNASTNPYWPSGHIYHCNNYWTQDPTGEFVTSVTAAPVGNNVTTWDGRGQGPWASGSTLPYNQGDWGYCDYRARDTVNMPASKQVSYLKDMAVATFRANMWGDGNDVVPQQEAGKTVVKNAICRMRNVDANSATHPNFSLKTKWYREPLGYCPTGQSWTGSACASDPNGVTGARLTPGGANQQRDIVLDDTYVYFTGANSAGVQSILRSSNPPVLGEQATSMASDANIVPTRIALKSNVNQELYFLDNAASGRRIRQTYRGLTGVTVNGTCQASNRCSALGNWTGACPAGAPVGTECYGAKPIIRNDAECTYNQYPWECCTGYHEGACDEENDGANVVNCEKMEDLVYNQRDGSAYFTCSGANTKGLYSVYVGWNWTQFGNMENKNGNVTPIVTTAEAKGLVWDPSITGGTVTNVVYFIDATNGKIIKRRNVNWECKGPQDPHTCCTGNGAGTCGAEPPPLNQFTDIVTGLGTGTNSPVYLAIDSSYVYWTDPQKGTVNKKLKDGSGSVINILQGKGLGRTCSAAAECGINGTCDSGFCQLSCSSDANCSSIEGTVCQAGPGQCQASLKIWDKGILDGTTKMGAITVDAAATGNVYFAAADKVYSMAKSLPDAAYFRHHPPSAIAQTGPGSAVSRILYDTRGVFMTVTSSDPRYNGANHYVETLQGTPGLIALWDLNEGTGTLAADTTPRALNASVPTGGTAPVWATNGGIPASSTHAMDWSGGKTQPLTVAHNSALNFTKLTISAWVTTGSLHASQREDHIIVDKSGGSMPGQTGYGLYFTNMETCTPFYGSCIPWIGAPRLCGYVNKWDLPNLGSRVCAVASANNSTFVHVVFSYDGATLKIYLNGGTGANHDPQATQAYGTMPTIGTNPLTIGSGRGNYYPWEGKLDQVRVYDRALTNQEVYDLYTGQAPYGY